MDERDDSRVSVEEVQMLLGERDIAIFALQRQLRAALEKIAELVEKKDPECP